MNNNDVLMKLKQWKTWVPWAAVFALGIFTLFFRIGHESLWYDESYTAIAVQFPIPEMIRLIGGDSHPPLYFIMLNLYSRIFGTSVIALRSFSAIGILALGALGVFPLQKIVKKNTAIVYSLLCYLTPLAIAQGQEARMYGWTAFWITGAFLFTVLLYRENKIRYWILSGVFALAASYTHYYGFISAGCMYLVLLVVLIVKKRKMLFRYAVLAIGLLAAYSPWFLNIYNQASRVVENYWIKSVTWDLIGRILGYPFSSNSVMIPPAVLWIGLALTAGVLFSISWAVIKKKEHREIMVAAYGIFILTILASILVSAVIRPILVERYTTSCLGLLLLAFALAITQFEKKWPRFLSFGLYVLTALSFLIPLYIFSYKGPLNEVVEDLENEVGPNDIFVHGSEQTMGTFVYYFPDNFHYLYDPEDFVAFSNNEIFKKHGSYGPDYKRFLDSRNPVWVVNAPVSLYAVPVTDFIMSDHLVQTGEPKIFSKMPGWFRLSVNRFEYVENKSSDQFQMKTCNIAVNVEGIADRDNVNLLYTIHGPGPMGPDTMIELGEVIFEPGTHQFIIPDVPFGEIAVLIYDDQNNNMRPDFSPDGGPVEGMGLSNNPYGEERPGFEDMKLDINQAEMEITIEVMYWHEMGN